MAGLVRPAVRNAAGSGRPLTLHLLRYDLSGKPQEPILIPYGRQDITQADIDAVVATLRSDFLTQGPLVPQFEAAIAGYCGSRHAVAANSATSALHIACLALGLGPGDCLWTSPITFVASANCGLYCGATVDFVDIDPLTLNMDPDALETKLRAAEKRGVLPKVVVVVHFGGAPCDMRRIQSLADRYGFSIIEDASHAIGATLHGRHIGNCSHGGVTVFSFHPVKIITTAEGGMATTNDNGIADRMALFRSHGITRSAAPGSANPEPWAYRQIELGYNYRLTDVHAAIGLSQAARIDSYVEARNALAARYRHNLDARGLSYQRVGEDCLSAYHLFVVRVGHERRHRVFESMRAQGIGVNVHYIPVHTQPYFRRMGFEHGAFPNAEAYYAEAITLPLFPSMSLDDQERVMAAFDKALVA